jgi:hypothetical protein
MATKEALRAASDKARLDYWRNHPGRWRFKVVRKKPRVMEIKSYANTQTKEEENKALVLKAFDTLFNKKDFAKAAEY